MDKGDKWLRDLANQMKEDVANGNAPQLEKCTVREFIEKFGYSRRGRILVSDVRNRLEELDLRTNPDFEVTYIDATISIELNQKAVGAASSSPPPDPTHRIGMLEAAHNKPFRVNPDDCLSVATTIMQLHDYSQLPVMNGCRNVKGIISWKSIGARLSLGKEYERVRGYMEPAQEISIKATLFDAIGTIVEHGYVLVRGTDKTITGIVTASDLSNQFMVMASPFLLIGEIEGHLRNLIHGKFTVEELQKTSPADEGGNNITGAADLTLGGYYQLLGKQVNWEKLNLNIDRSEFIQRLDGVRKIRNDVMHFEPDGLEESDTKMLRDVARFFEDLARMGAI